MSQALLKIWAKNRGINMNTMLEEILLLAAVAIVLFMALLDFICQRGGQFAKDYIKHQ